MTIKEIGRAATLLGLAMLLMNMPTGRVEGQIAKAPSHDLSATAKSFSDYSKDFRALGGSLKGDEWEEVNFLDQVASTAEDRIDAANAMLKMYDSISCAPDREKVTPILKKELAYYSWQMDNEADRSAGSLQFAKMLAVAQMGLRMKDDLRAAKGKLDTIAASLN